MPARSWATAPPTTRGSSSRTAACRRARCWARPGQGFKVAMSALDHGRLGVAAGAVGVAQACLDACVELHARAPAVRQAHRRLRDDPGDPGRYGRRPRSRAAAGLPRGLDEGPGPAGHASRPRSPSCSRPRRRSRPHPRRCCSTAGAATRTTTLSSAITATSRACKFTKAPAISSGS